MRSVELNRAAPAPVVSRSLRITFVCPNYPPEPAPAGVMAAQLSRWLVSLGHSVNMIVQFPSRPQGELYPGYRRRFRTVEDDRGVRVVRCAAWTVGRRRRPIDRVLENLTFGFTAAVNAFREGPPDILIVETWPLIAVQMAMLLGWLWKVPIIYYVQDVYPEAAEELGVIRKSSLAALILRAWDRFLCRRSARVVTVSSRMRDLICDESGDRYQVIHNWVDADDFAPLDSATNWRRRMGIPDDCFLALFAGTLGLVSGASVLIEVAELLKSRKNILIGCVGDGALKHEMMNEAARRGLGNIQFYPFQPHAELSDMLGSAGVLILTMQESYGNASVPSKLISYLAAARPVICSARSDTAVAQTVLAGDAGLVVAPGDASELADAIQRLAGLPNVAAQMGRNARRHFERHFTFTRASLQFREILNELSGPEPEVSGSAPAVTMR